MKNNVRHSEYYFRHVNDNIIISCHNDSTIHYITIHYRYIKVKKEIKFFATCISYMHIYIYFFFSFSFSWRNRQRNRMTFESIDSWWMRNTKAKDRKKKKKNKETWGQNNDKIAQLVRDFNCLNSISCFLPRNKKIAWSNNPREISCTRIIRKWKIVNYNLPDISWMSEREKNLQQLCLDV